MFFRDQITICVKVSLFSKINTLCEEINRFETTHFAHISIYKSVISICDILKT